MRVNGNYTDNGFALVKGLLDQSIVNAVLSDIKSETAPGKISVSQETAFPPILNRAAFEVYGPHFTPMKFLLWGLTPIMESLAKVPLAPSYNYFRVYREDDVCKVHSDRPACEHSMTLTLGYSNDEVWPFEVGRDLVESPAPMSEGFGESPFVSLSMRPGDAVIYRGVEVRHGRVTPNPNVWSAHIFLHWVERNGRFADASFECGSSVGPVSFAFD